MTFLSVHYMHVCTNSKLSIISCAFQDNSDDVYGSFVPTQNTQVVSRDRRQQERGNTSWEAEDTRVGVKGLVNDFSVAVRLDVEILFMINLSFFKSFMVYIVDVVVSLYISNVETWASVG